MQSVTPHGYRPSALVATPFRWTLDNQARFACSLKLQPRNQTSTITKIPKTKTTSNLEITHLRKWARRSTTNLEAAQKRSLKVIPLLRSPCRPTTTRITQNHQNTKTSKLRGKAWLLHTGTPRDPTDEFGQQGPGSEGFEGDGPTALRRRTKDEAEGNEAKGSSDTPGLSGGYVGGKRLRQRQSRTRVVAAEAAGWRETSR